MREKTIVAALAALDSTFVADQVIAVLLEGVPDGTDHFRTSSQAQDHTGFRLLPIVRIAPGCLCCAGNLTMRVHLNRLLRVKPQRLYIGVCPGTHLSTLQNILSQPPYDELLILTEPLSAV